MLAFGKSARLQKLQRRSLKQPEENGGLSVVDLVADLDDSRALAS